MTALPSSEDVFAAMDRHALWPDPGGRGIIACSGGLDSTALARRVAPALLSRGVHVVLACLDHGWRGDQGADDARFVEGLAGELGVGFVAARRTSDPALVADVGREAAARSDRRGWLVSLTNGPEDRIYLGHHQDDQLETVLLRLEQGVPEHRAASMAMRDGPWCRPLLLEDRARLQEQAEAAGWSWREDPSNADLRFARNRIRHTCVPELRARDPQKVESLLASGSAARLAIDERRREVERVLPEVMLARAEGGLVLDRRPLGVLAPEVGLILLRQLCAPARVGGRSPGRAVLSDLLRGCADGQPARLFELGAGCTARVSGDRVELSRSPLRLEGEEPAPRPLPDGEEVDWPGGWRFGSSLADEHEARRRLVEPDAGRAFAAFDSATLRRPISIRAAGEGLRLRPFGMTGSRALRDLLAEAGVPRPQRAAWPTLIDADDRVLWLPGVRASDAAPVVESGGAIILYTVAGPTPERAAASTPGTP
jgi:tRNA(Ile)-lysidine synthase